MSAIALAAKTIGCGASCASVAGVGTWILLPHLFGFEPFVTVYAISEKVQRSNSETVEFSTDNFQCKLNPSNVNVAINKPFNCEIMQWESKDQTLNHGSIYKNFTKTPDTKSLKAVSNVFQIRFRQKDWSEKDFALKIDIVAKTPDKANNSKKYASLKQLINFHENSPIKSESYFVVKNDESLGSFLSVDSFKCEWDNKQEKIMTDACDIYEFSTTNGEDYMKLAFSNSSTKATSLTQKHHYLIKFNKSVDTKGKTISYVDNNNPAVNKATFTIVKSAVLAKDKLLTF